MMMIHLFVFIGTFCVVCGMNSLAIGTNGTHPKELTHFSGNRRAKSMETVPWKNSGTFSLNDTTKRSKSVQNIRMTKDDIGTPNKMNSNKNNKLEDRKIFFWTPTGKWKGPKKEEFFYEPLAVRRFRQYLRVRTEQPKPDYQKNRDFLLAYAAELGLQAWEYECVPDKIFVGMTLAGSDPNLSSLLLYIHSDVVPANPIEIYKFEKVNYNFYAEWIHPPFDAYKDAEGNIFARGAQDMKSVGVQYMEALRVLLTGANNNGLKPSPFLRTVHILWGPDEEIGGHDGMEKFVKTDKFRALNVGFALDEGLASETDVYRVFYGERAVWWLKIICRGATGHGSRFIEDTAGSKLSSILNSFNDYRERQYRLLKEHSNLALGDVTSINLTKVEGGVQLNVIPAQYTVYFDIRVTPTDDFKALEAMFADWCTKAGTNVTFEFVYKSISDKVTPVDPSSNRWWRELSQVFAEENCKISTEIFSGGTDSRYLRQAGIPAIGFSPMINTPVLLHDRNEFLNERVFMDGVQLYTKIIPRLANLRD